MSSTPLKDIDLRVLVFDASEILLLRDIKDPVKRKFLMEAVLVEFDYPIESLPWDNLPEKNKSLKGFSQPDIEFAYKQIVGGLTELGYSGENLIVANSFGFLILIQFIKEKK